MSGIMADYVPVNERIQAFLDKHPDGCLQSEIVELNESRVVIRGYAYRTPDDPRPGIGHSSLGIPGTTSFTRGSEVENCETSAWGRAIAALGFEVKRGIATAEDVRNKTDDAPQRPAAARPAAARPHLVDTSVPSEPEELGALFEEPTVRADLQLCPIHDVKWLGTPGDLFHRKAEGGFCRHPDNLRKERAR